MEKGGRRRKGKKGRERKEKKKVGRVGVRKGGREGKTWEQGDGGWEEELQGGTRIGVTIKSCLLQMRQKVTSKEGKRKPQ